MGGCRCTFRQCDNSTSSKPGMHFFHFPIRDWPRLEIWARNANKPDFPELPLSKLKNKVVCQDHFENRMFMNYLKEGLVKTAVPALEILEDGSVLNVETNQVSEREEWLIPEKDDAAGDSMEPPMEQPETTRMEIQFVDSEHEEFNITPVVSPPPTPKILNKTSEAVPVRVSRNTDEANKTILRTPSTNVVLRKVFVKRKRKPSSEDSPSKSKMQIVSVQRLTKVSPKEEAFAQEEAPSAATPSSSTDVAPETPVPENPVQPSSTPSAVLSPPPAPAAPPAPVMPTIKIITDPAYIEKLNQTSAQIAEVKQLLTDVLNKPVPEPKVITVPVPTPVPAPPQPQQPPAKQDEETCPKMEKGGPHMNKVQLFNGIKRYLNPTMVALLRMELFAGAPERQYKADEKTLAVELVNLGENVYGHFLDEFRFRLPAKKDALKWKEEALDDDDDAS
ncbi:hypothetical protein RP20_CCG008438 [Aedes albopictus]|nr:hypothetical protein RP20_CCG008438 [Aedes albopictus]